MVASDSLSCSIDEQDFLLLCRRLVGFFPAQTECLESFFVKERSLKAFNCKSTNLLVRDAASLRIDKGHVGLVYRGGGRGLRLVLLCSLCLRFLLGTLMVLGIGLWPLFKVDPLRDAPELLRACVKLVNLFLL